MKLTEMPLAIVLVAMCLVASGLTTCAPRPEPVVPVQTASPVRVEVTSTRPAPTSPVVQSTLTVTSTSYHYGVVYAFPKSDWTEADRQAIREHLGYLRGLGINTIVQVFSSRLIGTGREKDWLIFLDEAERANVQVIARLWPITDWDGRKFDFQTTQSFLTVVQGHPALLAYLGLHEPLEQLDSNQLREYYAGVKRLAPQVAIANYMGSMEWFDKNPRFPNRAFTAGICDICIVYDYPARYADGQPAFEIELVRKVLQANRKLVDERAPGVQLWFMGQAFALRNYRPQLRMPTPDEMEAIYTIAEQERADGFLWYPWLQSSYDQVLSDPDMEPQRQAVRRIYETHILQKSTP
jgi:hypothetical protein